MAVQVLYDGIRPADDGPRLEGMVIEAIGQRPGAWKVWLTQGVDEQGFSMRIDGPDGAQFSYRFLKPYERSPEYVHTRIQMGLRRLDSVKKS